jgi:hypothetical protein
MDESDVKIMHYVIKPLIYTTSYGFLGSLSCGMFGFFGAYVLVKIFAKKGNSSAYILPLPALYYGCKIGLLTGSVYGLYKSLSN